MLRRRNICEGFDYEIIENDSDSDLDLITDEITGKTPNSNEQKSDNTDSSPDETSGREDIQHQMDSIVETSEKLDLMYQNSSGDNFLSLILEYESHIGEEVTLEDISLLIKLGADPNHQDNYGMALLHHVAQWENQSYRESVISLLINLGANPNIKDNNGCTPLEHAVSPWYISIPKFNEDDHISILIKLGADPFIRDKNGGTLLHLACSGSRRNANHIEKLIDLGHKPNHLDDMGRTSLHYACMKESYNQNECIQLLIDKGADSSIQDSNGKLPLHYIFDKDNYPVYKDIDNNKLIDPVANLNTKDNEGKTPLHHVCTGKRRDIDNIKLLIDRGSNPDIQDNDRRTPLHCTVVEESDNQDKCVQVLLEKGANPNIKDKQGETPFMLAIKQEDIHYLAIRWFIKHKAHITMKYVIENKSTHHDMAIFPDILKYVMSLIKEQNLSI